MGKIIIIKVLYDYKFLETFNHYSLNNRLNK